MTQRYEGMTGGRIRSAGTKRMRDGGVSEMISKNFILLGGAHLINMPIFLKRGVGMVMIIRHVLIGCGG
jgi:hypothetical protein